MTPLDYISEKGFPASIRRLLNRCASRLNRPWLVQFEDVPSASFLDSEENVVLQLPRGFGSGNGSLPGAFKCVTASATTIRVFFGTVKGGSSIFIPTGMHLGDSPIFTVLKVGNLGIVCLACEVFNDGGFNDGDLKSVSILCFSDPPDDTEDKFYLELGTYSADGNVTPGGEGNGVGTQSFELCGGLGGEAKFWKA